MRLVHEPSKALPLVSMSLALRGGAVHDPAGRDGMARYVARMIRRGGAGMKSTAIEETFDRMGAELLADAGLSYTVVSVEVLERNAERAAELLGKLLAAPSFEADEAEKLKREIAAELVESRDNDRVLAYRALRREAFAGHPYARRVSGQIATTSAITRDEASAHHERLFTQGNAIVGVAGHADEARAERLAGLLLAQLPEGRALVDEVPETAMPAGRKLVFVEKADRTQMQIYVGTMGTRADDDDHTALQVATSVFGGTFTARLMQEVRVKRGWSYGAYARLGVDRRREMMTLSAAPGVADAPACLTLLLSMLEELVEKGVTDDELSFMKAYLSRSYVFDIDTAQKRAQQKIDAHVYELPEGYHARYVERVNGVGRAQANEALARRVSPRDAVIAVVGDWDTLGARIEQAVGGLGSTVRVPYDLE